MQNIPLPIIPVQETFHLRQLSVNLFSIHNVKCNKVHVYVYHEGTARKSPDEVCSFVYNYLLSAPPQFTEVHVYLDNCGGRNKNHALNRVFLALTDTGRFDRIEQYYPIRGHSYLPFDRDFAVMKRKLERYDRVYTVHQITELIITFSITGKFTVKEVATEDIIDFQKWWPTFYKKSCISEETRGKKVPAKDKISFGISSLMHFTYGTSLSVTVCRPFIDGLMVQTYKMLQVVDRIVEFPQNVCYPLGNVSIKRVKLQDIRKLMQYVPDEFSGFYDELMSWPTTDEANDGEEEHDIQ